jgi:putative ABC transport system permease protein
MAVERAPLGFDPDHVFTLSFRLPPAKYPAKQDIARFFRESIERVRAIPGIESAALVRAVPLSGNGGEIAFTAEGQPVAKGSEPQARYHLVTPDYFRTMKMTLQSGRDFSDADTLESPAVAVVNQTFARSVWPGSDAIGRRIRTADMPDWLTVVGVVHDAVHVNPTERPLPQIYVSDYQNPQIFSSLVARTAQAPMSVMNDVRNAIWSVDKDQPVWSTTALDTIVANVRAPDRLLASLIGMFAAVAVAIASAGVYGVMAYSVSQRTQEIGIRLALGASPSLVRRDVIVRALSLVGIAVVGGLVIAVMVARIASSVLVGVQPTDATALGAAGVVLAFVAIAACYVPARRASRVDPLIALRQD